MRAVVVSKLEGPESIEVVEIDDPVPSEDDILIDVHAAGVAFPDMLQTRGLYQIKPTLPFVPGREVAGIVRSAPAGSGFSPGDRVAGILMFGKGMAESVLIKPNETFHIPDSISFAAAAGILFNDLTVHFALRERGNLRNGETVLVHGAAGGIGISTLRLATLLGAGRVIAVVSTPEKAELALKAGATDVVVVDGWLQQVKELTAQRGVDIVIDPVGGDRFTDSLRSLAPNGRVLVIGFAGGEIPTVKVNRLLLNNIDVRGVSRGVKFLQDNNHQNEQWEELRALFDSGQLSTPEVSVYSIDDAVKAFLSLEQRTALGKVVLAIR